MLLPIISVRFSSGAVLTTTSCAGLYCELVFTAPDDADSVYSGIISAIYDTPAMINADSNRYNKARVYVRISLLSVIVVP